jgi:hypothetical protein
MSLCCMCCVCCSPRAHAACMRAHKPAACSHHSTALPAHRAHMHTHGPSPACVTACSKHHFCDLADDQCTGHPRESLAEWLLACIRERCFGRLVEKSGNDLLMRAYTPVSRTAIPNATTRKRLDTARRHKHSLLSGEPYASGTPGDADTPNGEQRHQSRSATRQFC